MKRPLKAQLAAELSTASEGEADAIRAEFVAREKAMEHELDHKPCEVHMALSVAYNCAPPARARRARSRAHAAPPAARSPLQVSARRGAPPARAAPCQVRKRERGSGRR